MPGRSEGDSAAQVHAPAGSPALAFIATWPDTLQTRAAVSLLAIAIVLPVPE